jgi:TrmH family RNA methyltransferase
MGSMAGNPPPRIDSAANPRIKAAVALRDRRDRERTGQTIVDGAREARRALESGARPITAYVATDVLTGADAGADARAAVDLARSGGAEIVEVGPRAFERLAFGDRADGIVLVVETPPTGLEVLALDLLDHDPLLVVVEGLEKPGNLGAILRSADGAGADGVIAVGGTDVFNPNVVRASIGTVFSVPVATASVGDTRTWLDDQEIRIVAAIVDAEQVHTDADLTGPLAIVLGSEALGLSPVWRRAGIVPVRLPMLGVADSLNASVAAAVLLYEARRQRDEAAREDPAGASRRGDTGR